MNYYFPPEHIAAESENPIGVSVKFSVTCVAPAMVSYLLINSGGIFIGIVFGIIAFSSFLYFMFGYHRCLSCYVNYIPKSKKYCYECWQRAKQSSDSELNKDILNPES